MMPPGMQLAVGKFREAKAIKEPVDLTGQRFHMLVATEALPERDKHGWILWRCKCDCGGEAIYPTCQLRGGNAKSCGCLKPKRERIPLQAPPEFEDCAAYSPGKHFNGCDALVELLCATRGECAFYKSRNDEDE